MRPQSNAVFHSYAPEPTPLPVPRPARARERWHARLFWRLGVSSTALYRAQFLAATWKADPADVLVGEGAVTCSGYRDEIARVTGCAAETGGAALREANLRIPLRRWLETTGLLPLEGGGIDGALNVQAVPAPVIDDIARAVGARRRRIALITRQELIDMLIARRGKGVLHRATWRLRQIRPGESAADGVALWQLLCLFAFAGLVTGAAAISFRDTMTLLSAALSLVFLVTVGLRLVAAEQLAGRKWRVARCDPLANTADADLPRYTILVPLLREAGVLPALVENLRALDYPALRSKRTKGFSLRVST